MSILDMAYVMANIIVIYLYNMDMIYIIHYTWSYITLNRHHIELHFTYMYVCLAGRQVGMYVCMHIYNIVIHT